jgi:DNA repair protein RadC
MSWRKYEVSVERREISDDAFRIERPTEAHELFVRDAERSAQESLWVITLDGRNNAMGIDRVYQGTATGTSVRVGELFRYAVAVGGVGVIVVHNHPSGDFTPSDEDIKLTRDVVQAARLLDIEFLDHLVVSKNGFASIRSQKPSIWEQEKEGALSSFNAVINQMAV